jgi:hypothetical protein
MQAKQLTFEAYGHTLHHTQIQSADGKYLVYDTRNDDTKIGETDKIEVLDLKTQSTQNIYTCVPSTIYGPGVGAATFAPHALKTLFIHGIKNAHAHKPYGMTRRTGVAIELQYPQHPIYMDARNVYSPFTPGALRGGTHSHCWHVNGQLISFTYNDFILEQTTTRDADKDLRVVGVMFPKKVEVFKDEVGENNSGEMFSAIVSQVQNTATPGSDEIEKAFDECWLGNQRKLAFQGHVRAQNNNLQTEIFVVDLPDNLTQVGESPLEGTVTTRCGVPKGVIQRRITHTPQGISTFRHWLRSNAAGTLVYFLMEDVVGVTQLHQVEVLTSSIKQLSFHTSNIHSPFNINEKQQLAVYFVAGKLVVLNMINATSRILFESTTDIELTGIPHFCNTTSNIYFNAYVKSEETKYIQIFKIAYQ